LILPSGFIRLLEDKFVKQARVIARFPHISTAIWHKQKLSAVQPDWLNIYSETTCLVCIRERPQYCLSCGHIICETYIRRYGDQSDIWTFDIHNYFLYTRETSQVNINMKPPTATARLLSLDRSNARGIIPLVFLQALEKRIGLPYPVQGNFDFLFSTSSGKSRHETYSILTPIEGGIIAFALGRKGLSIEDYIDLFEQLAKQAFELYVSSYFRAILISLFTDSIYPARNLEGALQEVFGSNKSILDCSSAIAIGTKIGVIASTMKLELFLFINYNRLGDREDTNFEKYGILQGDALV
jgi:hypothetical protein